MDGIIVYTGAAYTVWQTQQVQEENKVWQYAGKSYSHAPKLGRTGEMQGKKDKNVAKCFRLFRKKIPKIATLQM